MSKAEKYRIVGGGAVSGELVCLGAKNFVTKAMVAALLGDTPTTFTNVPPIGDTDITQEMLESVGVKISRDGNTMVIDPSSIKTGEIPTPHSGSNRVPVLLLGALLHRCGEVKVPFVGGCKIGARSVDYHLDSLKLFGATVDATEDGFVAKVRGRLRGAIVELPYPSVGATETSIYGAVLAEGRTIIKNAALEPEIFELITMLRGMGAVIFTTSGREIRIDGVERLHGTTVEILGDRIEAASWASLACATDGEITVQGIRPETLGNFLSYFVEVGGGFDIIGPKSIRFYKKTDLKPIVIETDVWPGFSTDWQQPFAIVLCKAKGISIIHETVYENRFGYLKALERLGAKVQLTNHCLGSIPCRFSGKNHMHSAIITGPCDLIANGELEIPDLRAGLAYIIAAATAKGTTYLSGVPYVERGYGDIVPRLQRLNLQIDRV
jgi:UDP-N-acetylglucosamine 1-carboxyvinyltransferase